MEDIVFCDKYGFEYVYRDPTNIHSKVDNLKTRNSYGVIAKLDGLGEWQPYCMIKVKCCI